MAVRMLEGLWAWEVITSTGHLAHLWSSPVRWGCAWKHAAIPFSYIGDQQFLQISQQGKENLGFAIATGALAAPFPGLLHAQ